MPFTSDIAFSPTVKALQTEHGSRASYARIEERGGFRTGISAELAKFIAETDTAYLATANREGQPYAQHRGGPKGFIRVLDQSTLGFADFTGNRQYITTGNLRDNDKAFLFLMDYSQRRRIKLWGRARIVANDPDLVERLMPEGYQARAEQAVLFDILAWDVNCPQHIPRKLDRDDVIATIGRRDERIAELEHENAALRAQIRGTQS